MRLHIKDYRMLRGGSWLTGAWDCRAAYLDDFDPSFRYVTVGFRLIY